MDKITRILSAVALCGALTASLAAESPAAFSGWKTANTNHFRFIYEDATREQAIGFAKIADDAWNRIARIYGAPPERTDAILVGRTDLSNAAANAITRDMTLFVNPPLTQEFGWRADWQDLYLTHELIHLANMGFESKRQPLADVFGPFFRVFDFMDLPGWALEGLTTVLETELTPGGRGRSPYFELYYKAPTLENSFLKFADIGKETEPPRGQSYIMGYLLMRCIADRYGIGALADIERNRGAGRSFAESVKLVTGSAPDELFADVKLALEKKYAQERAIPEGKTISPRQNRVNYYRPALIDAEGFLTLRSSAKGEAAAVRYNPATGKETVLFEGDFPDAQSLAAAADGTVIAALQTRVSERLPGYTRRTDLYRWTREAGLTQLTAGPSVFQPALSRDGKRLVAVELSGLTYRLVEVDPRTGKLKTLVESPSVSYFQPALSADGSQLAFLAADGTRAQVCVAPMPKYDFAYPIPQANLASVYNASGAIFDPSCPSWGADGSLRFASNERGRLEAWEWRDGVAKPVLADPVGVIWADRVDAGVVYASYAATGNVIKIKPASEWGRVPDATGPSPAGVPATFGQLVTDYPAFNPYPMPAETGAEGNPKADGEATSDKGSAATAKGSATANTAATTAKAAPKLLLREGGDRTGPVQTELSPERGWLNLPTPYAWYPYPTVLRTDATGATAWGGGIAAIFMGKLLQAGAALGGVGAELSWYPTLNQVTGEVIAAIPVIDFPAIVELRRSFSPSDDFSRYLERTMARQSISWPILSRTFGKNETELALVFGSAQYFDRADAAIFGLDADLPWAFSADGRLGVDALLSRDEGDALSYELSGTASVGLWSSPALAATSGLPRPIGELQAQARLGEVRLGDLALSGQVGLKARWFDLPADGSIPNTLATLRHGDVDCLYPGRAIFQAALVAPGDINTRLFAETLVSFGTNTAGMATPITGAPLNLYFDGTFYPGIELEMRQQRFGFAFGLVTALNAAQAFDPLVDSTLYAFVKFDGLSAFLR